jgi:D-alanyl-D-alanine carboxypeptidase/D-alanyl-D-alanine-endopeptidase (penicillin-binding protein 4)
MRKLFKFCCLSLLFALLSAHHSQAQAPRNPEVPDAQNPMPFKEALDRIDKAAELSGVLVVSLSSGEVVCWSRPTDPLVPASLMKLLTSYAALKKLGPSFVFTTRVFAAEQPVNGVISGDIWIKGSGDPFFVQEKALQLAQAIKNNGVRQINGGIFVDDSFFQPPSERICLDSDCIGAYNPVVSPAAIDFNTLTVKVTLPAKGGKSFSVDAGLAGNYVQVSGQASSKKKGGNPLGLRSLGATGNGREQFQLSGRASARGGRSREFRFLAADPAGLFANSMRTALERSGVKVQGNRAQQGAVPPGSKEIASCDSAPLSELISGLNTYSNNFMAEVLLKSLGGVIAGAPGTSEKGIAVVRTSLKEAGIPQEIAILNCGSGLSRFCRVSPATFCRLLSTAWNDNAIREEFISSLAVNGGQGTLRRRMCKPGLTVRGKTGTLNDVIGFAGYVTGPSGRTCAAAVILNDVTDRAKARKAVDALLEEVAFSGL